MIYYLYEWLSPYNIPGIGMTQYISFRTAGAILISLIITIIYGKKLIGFLKLKQIGEEVRDLGLEGQLQKKGTPTMGGIIILAGIMIPTLLFARINNIYIILMLFTTLWLGMIGFADDYIKVFKKIKKGWPENSRFWDRSVWGSWSWPPCFSTPMWWSGNLSKMLPATS